MEEVKKKKTLKKENENEQANEKKKFDFKEIIENLKNYYYNNTKKVKMYGLIVIGVLIILVIAIVFLLSNSITKKVNEHALIYVTADDEIKYITSNHKEAITFSKNSDVSDIVYANTNTNFLYLKNDGLYFMNTTKTSEGAKKIKSDVSESSYAFSRDDKYIVFIDNDNNLYVYDYKDSQKLDTSVEEIAGISNDKVYYEKDDNIYVRSLKASKNDKKKIATVSQYIFNEDMTKMLYLKENEDLYDVYV